MRRGKGLPGILFSRSKVKVAASLGRETFQTG
jgi:hypothetical protein